MFEGALRLQDLVVLYSCFDVESFFPIFEKACFA